MHGFGIGPQSAAKGIIEEIPRLDVNSLALPAGGEGENEGDELGERELSVAGKILLRLLELRINVFGYEIEKRCEGGAQLA